MSELNPVSERGAFVETSPKRAPVSQADSPKVFLITGCIGPYYHSLFKHLRNLLAGLRIFVSTPMEPDRDWRPKWGDLPVTVQKCLSFLATKQFERGFPYKIWRHFPYDTLTLLIRQRPDVVISLKLGFR